MPRPAKKPEPVRFAEPAPKAAPKPEPPHETYKIIRRADRYLVEITLWGRVLHDSKDYARPEDAAKRLEELTKGHK